MRKQLPPQHLSTACPEIEILLSCARASLKSADSGRIRFLVQRGINWQFLVQLALQHRVVPILYQRLSSVCPESVPATMLDQLRDYFYSNTRRNLFLASELVKLVRLCGRHGFVVVPFKGPLLASLAYGDLSLRTFDDLDILVAKDEVLNVRDLLLSQGYLDRTHLTGEQELSYLRSGCAFTLEREDGSVTVDLHWQITPRVFPFPIELDGLWERLTAVSLGGSELLSLSLEDLALVLCVHGAKHQWSRFEWICAFSNLVSRHTDIDWTRILDQARRLGVERMCLHGLLLTNELLGAPLPHEVATRIKCDTKPKSLVTAVCGGLFLEANGCLTEAKKHAFYINVRERWPDRARYFFHLVRRKLIPTKKDLALLSLPLNLSCVYYFIRPVRLIREYGLGPLKLFLRHLFAFQQRL